MYEFQRKEIAGSCVMASSPMVSLSSQEGLPPMYKCVCVCVFVHMRVYMHTSMHVYMQVD